VSETEQAEKLAVQSLIQEDRGAVGAGVRGILGRRRCSGSPAILRASIYRAWSSGRWNGHRDLNGISLNFSTGGNRTLRHLMAAGGMQGVGVALSVFPPRRFRLWWDAGTI